MLILRWSFLAASVALSSLPSQLHCPLWWWPLVTCKIAFCHLNSVLEAISAPADVLMLLTEPSRQAAPSLGVSTPRTAYPHPRASPLLLSDSIARARMQSCLHREPLLSSDSGPSCCCSVSPAGRAWALDSTVCSVGPQWARPTGRQSPVTAPADGGQKSRSIGPLSRSSLGL